MSTVTPPPSSMWAGPGLRVLLVAGLSAAVSAVVHVAIYRTLTSLGEWLFPMPYGGVPYFWLGVAAASVTLGIAFALLRVGNALLVWVLGSPIAVISLLLTAKALVTASGPFSSGPAFITYVVTDSGAVAAVFVVAAILTDPRISRPVRIWVPLAVATVAVVAWTVPFLR